MKEKEKDFDTLASDILIELYNDIKEHETDLMEDTEKERRYEDRWDKDLDEEREKEGSSSAGDYSDVDKDDFCGPAGGAAPGTYPVDSEKRARAALSYAHNAPDPEGIKRCVYRKAKEHGWDIGSEEDSEKPSAGLSKKKKSQVAKKARKGGDIGKKGKGFAKVAKAAGGGEKGQKIAAAAMWKNIKR